VELGERGYSNLSAEEATNEFLAGLIIPVAPVMSFEPDSFVASFLLNKRPKNCFVLPPETPACSSWCCSSLADKLRGASSCLTGKLLTVPSFLAVTGLQGDDLSSISGCPPSLRDA